MSDEKSEMDILKEHICCHTPEEIERILAEYVEEEEIRKKELG